MTSSAVSPTIVAPGVLATVRTSGGWIAASDGATREVRSPYDGSVAGAVSWATADDVRVALDGMTDSPRPLPAHQRADALLRLSRRVGEEAASLAALICSETGLALRDCRNEVLRAERYLAGCAAEATRLEGTVTETDIFADSEQRIAVSVRRPRGLVYAVTPFNRPLHQVVVKVAPAIAAGCPILVKPSEKTPLTAVAFARLLDDCGLPPGWFSLVTGPADVVSDVVLGSGRVRLLAFTGSSAVGDLLARKVGIGRALLELGDSAALVVLPGADIAAVVQAASAGAFRTSGQSCRGVKRILAHHDVADELVAALGEAAEALVVGAPDDPATDIGTLIDEAGAVAVDAAIERAVAAGARRVAGGPRVGAQIPPTVLDHVGSEDPLIVEETFGPVAPIVRIGSVQEAIDLINGARFGLQTGIFTNDVRVARTMFDAIDVGTVVINGGPQFDSPNIPFGGAKASGVGREGWRHSVLEMTELKTLVL